VECIAKGKARTRYEFGVKTSIAVTNARSAGGQIVQPEVWKFGFGMVSHSGIPT
jgi:hypothetical protein